jgi:nucleoside-diphosphate kinase
MKDAESGRKFLKRTKLETSNKNLRRDDFFIGNTVNILSRELKLIDYGDSSTRSSLELSMEKSIILLPIRSINNIGQIIHHMEISGLTLDQLRSFILSKQMLHETLLSLDAPLFPLARSDDFVTLVAVTFRGMKAVERVLNEINDLQQRGAIHELLLVPKSRKSADNYYEMFLGVRHMTSANLEKASTCCIIKPHAVKSRSTGSVIDEIIRAGHIVRSLVLCRLDRSSAAEFLALYNGVAPDFNEIVDEMSSGPMVALEIETEPLEFRKFVGPWDIDMARALYPESLRAKFGISAIENAVHTTDLPRHVDFELRYIFELLDN